MINKEQIEEMIKDIPHVICEFANTKPFYAINGDIRQIAEALYNAGYRKTIWHNIANNDLPSKTGDYLTISRSGHYCVLKYCAEDFLGPYDEGYDFEKDSNMTNLKKGFNDFDSESCEFFVTNLAIAWTEIPKYE